MIALAIFAALQVADVTLTTLILRMGGQELNPAMRWLMDKLGTVPGLALPKVVLIGVFCAAMNYPGADCQGISNGPSRKTRMALRFGMAGCAC